MIFKCPSYAAGQVGYAMSYISATWYLLTTAFWKTAAVDSLFLFTYAVYLWRAPRTKKSGG